MLLNFLDCNFPIVVKVVEWFFKVVTPKVGTEVRDFLIVCRKGIYGVPRTVLDVVPDIKPQRIPKRSTQVVVNRIELYRSAGGFVSVSLRKVHTTPRIDITLEAIRRRKLGCAPRLDANLGNIRLSTSSLIRPPQDDICGVDRRGRPPLRRQKTPLLRAGLFELLSAFRGRGRPRHTSQARSSWLGVRGSMFTV